MGIEPTTPELIGVILYNIYASELYFIYMLGQSEFGFNRTMIKL